MFFYQAVFILFIIGMQRSSPFRSPLKFFLGAYHLRKTNNEKLENTYTYLMINDEENIKIRTIINNGFFATKVSRTGNIKMTKNNKLWSKYTWCYGFDNDIDFDITLNNVNKCTYSFLGIEFPKLRYKQISDYNVKKKVKLLQKNTILYFLDNTDIENNSANKTFYIFDVIVSNQKGNAPFVETQIYTLLFVEFIGFLLNTFFSNEIANLLSIYHPSS